MPKIEKYLLIIFHPNNLRISNGPNCSPFNCCLHSVLLSPIIAWIEHTYNKKKNYSRLHSINAFIVYFGIYLSEHKLVWKIINALHSCGSHFSAHLPANFIQQKEGEAEKGGEVARTVSLHRKSFGSFSFIFQWISILWISISVKIDNIPSCHFLHCSIQHNIRCISMMHNNK